MMVFCSVLVIASGLLVQEPAAVSTPALVGPLLGSTRTLFVPVELQYAPIGSAVLGNPNIGFGPGRVFRIGPAVGFRLNEPPPGSTLPTFDYVLAEIGVTAAARLSGKPYSSVQLVAEGLAGTRDHGPIVGGGLIFDGRTFGNWFGLLSRLGIRVGHDLDRGSTHITVSIGALLSPSVKELVRDQLRTDPSFTRLSASCAEFSRNLSSFDAAVKSSGAYFGSWPDSAYGQVTFINAGVADRCFQTRSERVRVSDVRTWTATVNHANMVLADYMSVLATIRDTVAAPPLQVGLRTMIVELKQEICEQGRDLEIKPTLIRDGANKTLDDGYVMIQIADTRYWRRLRGGLAPFTHPKRDFQVTIVGFFEDRVYINQSQDVPNPQECTVEVRVEQRGRTHQ